METKSNSVSYQKIFETKWFSIEMISNNCLKAEPYYRLSCDDSVEILAVTPDEKIVLVRQFRPALGIFSFELPAGYVDDGESKNQAIVRELKEETGYFCNSISYIGGFKIASNRINNTLHVFFGKDAKPVNKKLRKSEKEVILLSKHEFEDLIKDGKFVEMPGIALYFLVLQNGYL